MMKTKANIKKRGAHQKFKISVHLEGYAEDIDELVRALRRRDSLGGRSARDAQWKLWRAAYLLLLGVFLVNLPELAVRAISG